jgi:hypothetical protein
MVGRGKDQDLDLREKRNGHGCKGRNVKEEELLKVGMHRGLS